MKRVAIPIVDNKLSEYFGSCSYYEIFDIENGQVNKRQTIIPPIKEIQKLPEWISHEKITDVIVYRVNEQIISMFSQHKINLFVGIPMNNSDEIIEEYLTGNLKSNNKIISEILQNQNKHTKISK